MRAAVAACPRLIAAAALSAWSTRRRPSRDSAGDRRTLRRRHARQSIARSSRRRTTSSATSTAGWLAKRRTIPADKSRFGIVRRSSRDQDRGDGCASLRRGAVAHAQPAETGARSRSATSMRPSWTRRASKRAASSRSQPTWRPSTRVADQADARRADGPARPTRRRLPVGLYIARRRPRPDALRRRRSARRAWACRTATTTSSRRREVRRRRAAYVDLPHASCSTLSAAKRERRRRPQAVFALETKLAQAQWAPGREPRPGQDLQPVRPRRAGARSRRLRLAGVLDASGLGGTHERTSSSASRATCSGARAQLDARAAGDLEGLPAPSTSLTPTRRILRQGLRRRALRVRRQGAARHDADGRAGSAACAARRAFGRGARQALRREALPAGAQGADGRAGREPARRVSREHRLKLDWMGAATQAGGARQARRRSPRRSATRKRWSDYGALDDPPRRPGRQRRARARLRVATASVAKLGKPVDRDEWRMTPQTVNAYYRRVAERDRLPGRDPAAAVLRPDGRRRRQLRRDRRRHRPRDQPRLRRRGQPVRRRRQPAQLVDAPTTASASRPRRELLVDAVRGLRARARLQRQRRADAGREHRRQLAASRSPTRPTSSRCSGKAAPVIDGITGDQRFFFGYAQSWRGKVRDEALLAQIKSDPHSPDEFRVNGAVRNMPAFYSTFKRQAGRQDVPAAEGPRLDLVSGAGTIGGAGDDNRPAARRRPPRALVPTRPHSRAALASASGRATAGACWLTVMIGTMASIMASTIINVAVPDMSRVFGARPGARAVAVGRLHGGDDACRC